MRTYGDTAEVSPYDDIVDERLILARSLPKLGQAIKVLRRDRGLTQAELAAAADVSRRWLMAVESGRTPGAEVGLILRVLDTLDASLVVRDDRQEP